MTHNLEWRDIRALFETIGDVEVEHNGNLKVTMAGHAVVFHSPNDADTASPEQVNQIRHLLKDYKVGDGDETGPHLLVVMDHQEARVYRTMLKGSVPEQIAPFDPDGYKSHVRSAHPGQSEQTNFDAYFREVAQSLHDAEKILIFGSGTGQSSAMDSFVAWLKEHHNQLSERIIDTVTVDQSHLTEGQLLAKAREIYEK